MGKCGDTNKVLLSHSIKAHTTTIPPTTRTMLTSSRLFLEGCCRLRGTEVSLLPAGVKSDRHPHSLERPHRLQPSKKFNKQHSRSPK
eukprot:2504451-Amphidinium_carterae.1